jgi:Eukaryotic cytochrome b561
MVPKVTQIGRDEVVGTDSLAEGYFSQSHQAAQISLLVLSWTFAIASLVLCAVWGSRNGIQYLNIPSWDNNVFAWHPLLLVCGFFFSQVFVLTTAGVFPTLVLEGSLTGWAWLYHGIWQCAATATLIGGLLAVFKDYNTLGLPNLTSVHSWLGIATAVLFFLNFLLAGISALSAFVFTQEPYLMRGMRALVRIATFQMTAMSIGSGIMLFQGETGCFYPTSNITPGIPDYNPAANYGLIPPGCLISNGLAITVALSTLCTIFFIAIRYEQLILMLALDRGEESTAKANIQRSPSLSLSLSLDVPAEKGRTEPGVAAQPLSAAGAVL